MGITSFDIRLIEMALEASTPKSVIELGAQNLYDKAYTERVFANTYFEARGIKYTCIDMNGENNAMVIDLSEPIEGLPQYDLLTDFGTSEHVGAKGEIEIWDGGLRNYLSKKYDLHGFYNCWKNKHTLLKKFGIMINVNPKTGNWKDHGFNYYTEDFYHHLAKACNYSLITLGENAAMGNTKDGWNIYCILRKLDDKPFISEEEFNKLLTYIHPK